MQKIWVHIPFTYLTRTQYTNYWYANFLAILLKRQFVSHEIDVHGHMENLIMPPIYCTNLRKSLYTLNSKFAILIQQCVINESYVPVI